MGPKESSSDSGCAARVPEPVWPQTPWNRKRLLVRGEALTTCLRYDLEKLGYHSTYARPQKKALDSEQIETHSHERKGLLVTGYWRFRCPTMLCSPYFKEYLSQAERQIPGRTPRRMHQWEIRPSRIMSQTEVICNLT